MFLETQPTIPLQTLQHPLLIVKDLSLQVLRTDQTDAIISGNKWFKLKHNLIEAQNQGHHTLVSFGGPYSNHLHALATAGKANGFNTIGIIRGEEHLPLNPTLSDVVAQGMQLYYINRATYRNKHSPDVLKQLKEIIAKADPFGLSEQADNFYLVPEGGTNELAVRGASEIASFIPENTDYVCVPCGTGGTIAGIISGLIKTGCHHTKVLGFPALKGGQFLEQTIVSLLREQGFEQRVLYKRALNQKNPISEPIWQLFHDFHFGGFGKINHSLALFIRDFEKDFNMDIDPVYTAKMMYAIVKLIKNDFFPKESKIVAVHTGGLQGKRGMEQKIQALIESANV